MIRDIIQDAVFQALGALNISVAKEDILIEHPADLNFGDYSTNIAMVLAKKLGQNPKDLAEQIAGKISGQNNDSIEKVVAAGAFINLFLSKKFLGESVKKVIDRGEKFGNSDIGSSQKVVVEYSSPNIAKPFTIGHLRSTIIGDAIANILMAQGYDVARDNHLGDWGTQFGKQIVAIKRWGNLDEIAKAENPVKALVELYVKFHEEAEKDPALEDEARAWFTKLEKKDLEAVEIWQKCIELSMKEFEKIYEQLGVKFDTSYGESFFEDKMSAVIEEIKSKGLGRESEGAYLIFYENDKIPPFMLLKKDGSTLYALRDLAADKFRQEKYGNDVKIINEVGNEQTLHFQQLFEAEKMLGWFKDGQRVHVGHGLFRFKDGKMSTRKGNVIWLEEVIGEAMKRAGEFNPEVAEVVGIGAIKYNDLKKESAKDVVFDWDEILNLKGNSGPYLQYAYARTQSILAKAETEGVKGSVGEAEGSEVEKILYRFPEVVERAGKEYAPHYICTYLYELADAFNSYYAKNQIVTKEVNSPHRVALTEAVGIVLKNGLNLLGIQAPQKM